MKKRIFREVDNLCKTIETIPGVKVSQGATINDKVYVWFGAYDPKLLFPVARGVNNRYGCVQFHLNVEVSDTQDIFGNYVQYVLTSMGSNLESNLIEADKLSVFIDHYMTADHYKDASLGWNMLEFSGMDKVIEEYKRVERDNKLNDIIGE